MPRPDESCDTYRMASKKRRSRSSRKSRSSRGHGNSAGAKAAFVSYIMSFYGPRGGKHDGLGYFEQWGYAPMKRAEAARAAAVIMKRKDYGDGDSLDRERARDVVLAWRGLPLAGL